MKKIYISENQINILSENEITFYEFVINVKSFLKDLLKKPMDAKPSDLLSNYGIDKNILLQKLDDIGLIKSKERIDEVPIEEKKHPYHQKLVAKHYITYSVKKNRFYEKLKELYKDLIKNKKINEEGEGATSCGSVMQGGGSNPNSGQYEAPFSNVQRREFWNSSLQRKNKDNKSISINH